VLSAGAPGVCAYTEILKRTSDASRRRNTTSSRLDLHGSIFQSAKTEGLYRESHYAQFAQEEGVVKGDLFEVVVAAAGAAVDFLTGTACAISVIVNGKFDTYRDGLPL
jgi:hypothetical protein